MELLSGNFNINCEIELSEKLIFYVFTHCMLCSRNSLMSSHRSSDGDKLTPSQTYSSSRGPLGLDGRPHHHHNLLNQHNNHNDDDDKLLDVVGPPHSPLLSSLQQMQSQAQGECINNL